MLRVKTAKPITYVMMVNPTRQYDESCTIPLTEAKLAMSQEYINLL